MMKTVSFPQNAWAHELKIASVREGGSSQHISVVISKSAKYQFRTLFVPFCKTLVCGIWVVYAYTVTYVSYVTILLIKINALQCNTELSSSSSSSSYWVVASCLALLWAGFLKFILYSYLISFHYEMQADMQSANYYVVFSIELIIIIVKSWLLSTWI